MAEQKSRRRFLLTAPAVLSLPAVARGDGTIPKPEPGKDKRRLSYEESPHIRAYYERARY